MEGDCVGAVHGKERVCACVRACKTKRDIVRRQARHYIVLIHLYRGGARGPALVCRRPPHANPSLPAPLSFWPRTPRNVHHVCKPVMDVFPALAAPRKKRAALRLSWAQLG